MSRSHLTARPSNISALEAAGVALVGLTAVYALYELANLQPGQNVFINGGSTAVGILAVQMAKATGCTVTASASTKREEFLKSIGVDHVRLLGLLRGPIVLILHFATHAVH